MSEICECTFFDEGDWVESRLNSNVFGIVISNSDFGRLVHVQLAGSMKVEPFYAVTLRHMDEPSSPPSAQQDLPDNVIPVDFTKARKLREETKTEGAA